MQYAITVLAGLGLIYAGLRLLAYSYRRLASRRLDAVVRSGIGGTLTPWLAGLAVGAVARNAGTITLTAGGLLSTEGARPSRVLALLCGAAVGTAFLVFLVPIAPYTMGIGVLTVAAILFLLDIRHADQAQFAGEAVLATIILFIGLVTARFGGEALAAAPGASDWLAILATPPAALLIGAVLGGLTVSAWHAAILVIAVVEPGVLAPAAAALALAGALAGSTLAELVLLRRLGGTVRQLVNAQIVPRLAAAVVAVAGLLASVGDATALAEAVGSLLHPTDAFGLAVLYLALQVLTGVCLWIWIGPRLTALVRHRPDGDEALAAPRYLFDADAVDPETALDLIRREQDRIVPHLALVVESALPENRGTATGRAEATTRGIAALGQAIDRFATDLIDRSHERRPVARATRAMIRTNALMELNAALSEFAVLAHVAATSPAIAPIVDAMSESLHALVTAVGEALGDDRSGDDLALARALTDDRSGILRRLREKVGRSDDLIETEDLGFVYQMTGVLERCVWLLRHLVDDEAATPGVPARPSA
ncbi:hypothetical protein GCM10017083_08280 [Thalassobaculum fulvum]|uniref:Phosphate:Na+ symporter n=1 Tax=Thalassobaculum fulvum TaxID=1633335 RepID=A0A919CPF3_9PROT|nr:hypothetical protein [Thalassobaculum fulvum]GHD42837.1 hypothetical protein GCM10017083_08280 [Thalassobaculum fulvum]